VKLHRIALVAGLLLGLSAALSIAPWTSAQKPVIAAAPLLKEVARKSKTENPVDTPEAAASGS
jgi:hypothetical protein